MLATEDRTVRRPWHPERLGALLLATLVAGGLAASAFSSVPAYAQDDEGNLSVEIVDPAAPSPSPSPTPTPAAPAAPAPAPRSTGTPGASAATPAITQSTITDAAAADAALGPQSESMAGLIYVSAAHTAPRLSLHPDGGEVAIVLSLRNVASETVDGTARFWITTAWGWGASEPVEVEVTALAPGETRELTATLPGPGQWAFYQAHAEYTPPATVDGVDLAAITRTEFLFILPLFALGVAGVAGIVVGAYVWGSRVLARREGLGE